MRNHICLLFVLVVPFIGKSGQYDALGGGQDNFCVVGLAGGSVLGGLVSPTNRVIHVPIPLTSDSEVSRETALPMPPILFPFDSEILSRVVRDAYEKSPTNWLGESLRIVAMCYIKTGEYEKARQLLTVLHEERPFDSNIAFPLASLTLLSGGDAKSAEALFLQCFVETRERIAWFYSLASAIYCADRAAFVPLATIALQSDSPVSESEAALLTLAALESGNEQSGKRVYRDLCRKIGRDWTDQAGPPEHALVFMVAEHRFWPDWFEKRFPETGIGEALDKITFSLSFTPLLTGKDK